MDEIRIKQLEVFAHHGVFPEENRMERVENVKSVDDYISRIDEMIRRKKESWR